MKVARFISDVRLSHPMSCGVHVLSRAVFHYDRYQREDSADIHSAKTRRIRLSFTTPSERNAFQINEHC